MERNILYKFIKLHGTYLRHDLGRFPYFFLTFKELLMKLQTITELDVMRVWLHTHDNDSFNFSSSKNVADERGKCLRLRYYYEKIMNLFMDK